MLSEQSLHNTITRIRELNPSRDDLLKCLSCLDLTNLNEEDDESVIQALCDQTVTPFGKVAALCVYPRYVKFAAQRLKPQKVTVATVVNFPHGVGDISVVGHEIKQAINDGATEIDVVFPYSTYLTGNRHDPLAFIKACKLICGPRILLKVILETGALPDLNLLAQLTREVVNAGADFIKTSTGKIKVGATLEAAATILSTIKAMNLTESCGCKISGGVRDSFTANHYLKLAEKIMGEEWVTPHTFRIGSSSLLIDLLSKLSRT